jgi:hydrogenase expression/formation protein HypE
VNRKLQLGKIPISVLDRTVLRLTGAPSASVVTPPRAGLDFAAVKLGSGYMIISADPITGVTPRIGEYAIKVSANDVATSGNRPQFAESVILLPEGSSEKSVSEIAAQMDGAARELRMAIVGGHTEVTPGLTRPIVMVTVIAFVESYVSSMDARPGDAIMMTKTAGIEGTAVLASVAGSLGLPQDVIRGAKKLLRRLSIVDEAVAANRTGCVHAMHDCTEGGLLGAVYEMSLASGLGFELRGDLVPLAPETKAICREFSADPLKLIGSGSLLLAVERGAERKVEKALAPVCQVTRIGEFNGGKRVLVKEGGVEAVVKEAPEDELWRLVSRTSRRRRGG